MANTEVIVVPTAEEMKSAMVRYAARGFTTLHSDTNSVTLSQKKPFNWILAIICLFIPVIGWIALIFMLMAAGRGSNVVEIKVA